MLRIQGNRARAALFALAALVLTVAVASTGCKRDTAASAQTAQPKRTEMRTVTVPVEGMICMVCAGSVKNALKAVHGVQNAEVNLEKRNATIHFENGKVSLDQLTRAINELGYRAGVPATAQAQ